MTNSPPRCARPLAARESTSARAAGSEMSSSAASIQRASAAASARSGGRLAFHDGVLRSGPGWVSVPQMSTTRV